MLIPAASRILRAFIIVMLVSGCAQSGRFPGTTELILDADTHPEWFSRVASRAGTVTMTFTDVAQESCYTRVEVRFLDSRLYEAIYGLNLNLSGNRCVGDWQLGANYYPSDEVRLSKYLDTPLDMTRENTLTVSWRKGKLVDVRVNGETLIHDKLGRRFSFMQIKVHVGAIKFLTLDDNR